MVAGGQVFYCGWPAGTASTYPSLHCCCASGATDRWLNDFQKELGKLSSTEAKQWQLAAEKKQGGTAFAKIVILEHKRDCTIEKESRANKKTIKWSCDNSI